MARELTPEELVKAPMYINRDVQFEMPRRSTKVDKKYKCTCCGKSWDNQRNHFAKSPSPLYQSNDGYINICNDCMDLYLQKLINYYNGNEVHAIKHVCQQFDVVFHVDAYKNAKVENQPITFSQYLSKRNLHQTTKVGNTYLDGMKTKFYEDGYDHVMSAEQAVNDDSISISGSATKRWGAGFTQADYKNLDEHYNMLKDNNPNIDQNQEIFVKSLCNLYMLQIRALQAGDSKKYIDLSSQYSKTFNDAGLKTVEEKDESQNTTLGVTLATISKYTPEEFYKDKPLYEDYDDLADYVDRFMLRPLRNLQYGSSDRDKEYFIPDDEDLDDE